METETGDTKPPLVWCALEELVKQQALLLLGLSELKKKKGKALLLGHRDARPNLPFVQEERLDEVVDMLGALQLQRVPCVLDDLQPGIASQMPAFSNDSWQNVQR